MGLGKVIRLKRLFSHRSGRLCSVAVDHYIVYGIGLPASLRRIESTLAALVAGLPDAITMHKGVALSAWEQFGGQVPWILQTVIARPDDTACEQVATVEEAVRLGADAVATVAFLNRPSEAAHIRVVADMVREAARYDMPVVAHVYPRVSEEAGQRDPAMFSSGAAISLSPEDVAWAVHCALEVGVDVIKTPYCGDVAAFRDIIEESPRPVVVAGGPKTPTLAEALAMTSDAMRAGARGATVGRNIWSHADPTSALRAFKAVIHDGASPEEAMRSVGL